MPSINLDAQWLRDFVTAATAGPSSRISLEPDEEARLLLIARHIEGLEEKLAALQSTPAALRLQRLERAYIEGSNFPAEAARDLEQIEGDRLFAQIEAFPKEKIKRVASGASTAPKPRVGSLAHIKLDLSSVLKRKGREE